MLRSRVLGDSFSSIGCSIFEFWVLHFRDLGASCFGLHVRLLRFQNYPYILHLDQKATKCKTCNQLCGKF